MGDTTQKIGEWKKLWISTTEWEEERNYENITTMKKRGNTRKYEKNYNAKKHHRRTRNGNDREKIEIMLHIWNYFIHFGSAKKRAKKRI